VRAELRAIAAVVPLPVRNLGHTESTTAYMSDASLQGYALHRADLPSQLAAGAMRLRDRWQFQRDGAIQTASLRPHV
jgi:hypothetical protein